MYFLDTFCPEDGGDKELNDRGILLFVRRNLQLKADDNPQLISILPIVPHYSESSLITFSIFLIGVFVRNFAILIFLLDIEPIDF